MLAVRSFSYAVGGSFYRGDSGARRDQFENIENFEFSENLTGEENLLNNGYRLLWDVGNFVFLKKYDKEIN